MIRVLFLSLLLLAGCARQAPLPEGLPSLALPQQWHILREQGAAQQDWLLVVQQEGAALRWSMMDPLGIPQARQRLVDGQWQADGLLPPNPEARELFAALLFALTPDNELAARYPGASRQGAQRHLASRWSVTYNAPRVFTLSLAQGLRYHITPLNDGTAP